LGYIFVAESMCLPSTNLTFSIIMQSNGLYTGQRHSKSPILVTMESRMQFHISQ